MAIEIDSQDVTPEALVAAAVVALIAMRSIALIVRLLRRTYYALVIETSGFPQALVVSPNASEIEHAVRGIVQAINRPGTPFNMTITNHTHIGDNYGGDQVNVFGRNNIGKVNK